MSSKSAGHVPRFWKSHIPQQPPDGHLAGGHRLPAAVGAAHHQGEGIVHRLGKGLLLLARPEQAHRPAQGETVGPVPLQPGRPGSAGKAAYSSSRAASTAAAISARRGARPRAWARETATGATSGPKSAAVWVRLIPTPTTTWRRAAVSASSSSSVRMPHSFRPSRITSLGHLIPGRTPHTRSTALHTATAVHAVRVDTSSRGHRGRRRTDR